MLFGVEVSLAYLRLLGDMTPRRLASLQVKAKIIFVVINIELTSELDAQFW